jgi:hypothetical protein
MTKKLFPFASIAVVAAVACSNEVVAVPGPGGAVTPPPEEGDPTTDCARTPMCPTHCENATVGKLTCNPGEAAASQKSSEKIGRFTISDFEYWPWKEKDPIYPDKVLWGYKAGTPAAMKCMTEARKVLVDILTNDVPPELEELRVAHPGVRSFYNWNNDMTDAPASRKVPEMYEGLWLYEEGLIKWMSHTERDGSCRLPNRDDLVTFAKACLKTFPNCGSGKPSAS